jgi:N-acetylmuramoyl-L-alanine amidase
MPHEARTELLGEKQRLQSPARTFAGSASRVWRWRTLIAATAASVLLPIEASDAGWVSDFFKGSSKQGNSPTHHVPSTRHATSGRSASSKSASAKSASVKSVDAPKPHARLATSPPLSKSAATPCDPAKFRIALDVGHTAQSEGASSARNVAEFDFNLRLAQRVEEKLKAEGFAETKLLVTTGKARSSLVKRVNAANNMPANLFLSIHHDSVPNKLLENWEFEGKKSHFSDRFSGYSVFVSHDNPDFKTSLAFAELVGKEMKTRGLDYAHQYTQAIMGRYQHPLLDKETGVYSYDQLIVLKTTRMPAVLLEAGSIINRDEELKMGSPERRDLVGSAVVAAVKQFCEPKPVAAPPPVAAR